MFSSQPPLKPLSSSSSVTASIFSALRPFLEGISQIIDSARWALRISWTKHITLIVSLGLVTLIQGGIPAAMALIVRGLINAAVSAAQMQPPSFSDLLPWIILGIGVTILESVGRLAHQYLTLRLTDDLTYNLTTQILQHAARLDVATFETPRSEDVVHRAQQNVASHFAQFLISIFTFASRILEIASLTVVLIILEPLTIAILLPLAFVYLLFQWKLSKEEYLEEHARTTKRRWIEYYMALLMARTSASEVKLLNLAPLLLERCQALINEFHEQGKKRYRQSFFSGVVFVSLTSFAVYGVFSRVLSRFLQGLLTVGDIAIFGTAGLRLRSSLEGVIISSSTMLRHALYVTNLKEFLLLPLQPDPSPEQAAVPIYGALEFHDVSFSYPDSATPTLSNISFHIKPGETVALVGKNGAGKTTLVKLIARFYEPNTGQITCDGRNLHDIPLSSLRRQIAFVFQTSSPYEASVADNIAYGNWTSLLTNRDQVAHIARYIGIDKLIEGMPRGYDTLLGRSFGEYDLSGGQWQHLAIARAFARDAQVLILDEPSSNLDAAAEYELFERFRQLAHGKTTILISHRFSTVKMADRVIVLDKGTVVESGTHRQLIAKQGLYATLYELQRQQLDVTT